MKMMRRKIVDEDKQWETAYDYVMFQVHDGYPYDRRLQLKPSVSHEDVATAYAMVRCLGLAKPDTFWEWALENGMAHYVEKRR